MKFLLLSIEVKILKNIYIKYGYFANLVFWVRDLATSLHIPYVWGITPSLVMARGYLYKLFLRRQMQMPTRRGGRHQFARHKPGLSQYSKTQGPQQSKPPPIARRLPLRRTQNLHPRQRGWLPHSGDNPSEGCTLRTTLPLHNGWKGGGSLQGPRSAHPSPEGRGSPEDAQACQMASTANRTPGLPRILEKKAANSWSPLNRPGTPDVHRQNTDRATWCWATSWCTHSVRVVRSCDRLGQVEFRQGQQRRDGPEDQTFPSPEMGVREILGGCHDRLPTAKVTDTHCHHTETHTLLHCITSFTSTQMFYK